MKYLVINKGLYLVQQEVQKPEAAKPAPAQTNHIWIYDRSWSMGYEIKGLCRDLIERAKKIPTGDTITLGWFSTEGKRNFILKGFKITEKADYQALEKAIRNNNTCIGLTCFSEILHDTKQVIEDLSVISTNFSLCFFTDGYPVVSNYSREVREIHKAVESIEGGLTSALFIGYGNYYNKDLMAEMAERSGGSLAHSSSLNDFSVALEGLIEDSRENSGKIQVELAADVKEKDLVFGINGRQVNIYLPSLESGKPVVNFVPKKSGTNYVYFLMNKIPRGYAQVVELGDDIQRPTKNEPMVKAAYAAAFLLTQKTKTDVALEVLGVLGDKFLIDRISNAYTNEEYGNAEKDLKKAVTKPKKGRFVTGRDTSYLPKSDAFCLLDTLDILMADNNAKFYPYHPDFSYSRIGMSAKTKEGYPEFKADKNSGCFINGLAWNKTKLNLSLQGAKINGTIELGEGHEKHGFSKVYPTYVFRAYALVKDGFLNTKKLPVSLSEDSFNELAQRGLIDVNGRDGHSEGGVYVLHLDRVPVINRQIAEGKTSAKELFQKIEKQFELEAKMKVLKAKVKELDPDEKLAKADSNLTEAQEEFLAENGIGKNGFAPPKEKMESVDKYLAKEFTVKIKGFSSLPKVADIVESVKNNKKLNAVGELMKKQLDWMGKTVPLLKSPKAHVQFLKDLADEVKKDLVVVSSEIQKTKFAIILGKKWFDEFDSREDNTLNLHDKDFTVGVREVQVKI